MDPRTPNHCAASDMFPADGLMSMLYGIAGDLERPIELEKPTRLEKCDQRVDDDGQIIALKITNLLRS